MDVIKKIECCIDCEFHLVIRDDDPTDGFCDDDVAVVCTLKENDKRDMASKYLSDRHRNKCITRSCRPHYVRKETTPIPKWCPKGFNV